MEVGDSRLNYDAKLALMMQNLQNLQNLRQFPTFVGQSTFSEDYKPKGFKNFIEGCFATF
jgi:hypothetical protein